MNTRLAITTQTTGNRDWQIEAKCEIVKDEGAQEIAIKYRGAGGKGYLKPHQFLIHFLQIEAFLIILLISPVSPNLLGTVGLI